jgi:hypothetical protein
LSRSLRTTCIQYIRLIRTSTTNGPLNCTVTKLSSELTTLPKLNEVLWYNNCFLN